VFTPQLPRNLIAMCGGDKRALKLVRELLRALGGCLVAVGLTVAILVNSSTFRDDLTRGLVLLLVLPSAGINAFSMYRVGSPFLAPLAFVTLTIVGAPRVFVLKRESGGT
jgi:hypothetical protein